MELNWTYKECLYFIEDFKKDYEFIMHSFYVVKNKWEVIEKLKKIKRTIYDLKMEEWKKDKLWEFMNGDVEYSMLWSFV